MIHRATATTRANQAGTGSAFRRIRVSALALKFCTITSWMHPQRRCNPARAKSESITSSRRSPIPTRIPLVNGTLALPAASMVATRNPGSLSGQSWWGMPGSISRGEMFSSISPIDGLKGRSERISGFGHHTRVGVRKQLCLGDNPL